MYKYLFEKFDEYLKFLKEQQTNPELIDEIEKEIESKSSECPRCGEKEDSCICQDRDQFSTVNAFRAPSGEKKTKEDFK